MQLDYDVYKNEVIIIRFDSVENMVDSRSFADYVSSYMQGNQNL